MTRSSSALLVLWASIAGIMVLSPTPVAVRVVVALPLALFFPGYALVLALFPAGTEWAERFALAIAFSTAVGVFGGFLLHWSPFGLSVAPWVLLLSGTTVAAAIVGWVRRSREPDTAEERGDRRFRPRIAWRSALTALLAVVLAGAAIGLARTPLHAKGIHGYTVLWLLPGKHGANTVRVGVISSELHETSYRLELRAGEHRVWVRQLTLAPTERWEAVVDVTSIPTRRRSLVALLYRAGENKLQPSYRRASLVLPGSTLPPTTLIWLFPLNNDQIRVGMTSAESQATFYRLEVYAGSQVRWLWRLKLAPGEQWNAVLNIRSLPEERRSFEALLYRAGDYAPQPALRRATLVLPGATAPLPRAAAVGNLGP